MVSSPSPPSLPPLPTRPQEPFLCPRCQALNPGSFSGGKPFTVEFARASGGDTAWRLAQLLATKDYRWGRVWVGNGGGGVETGLGVLRGAELDGK